MEITIDSKKPKLSFWQIWNMSFGFLGIQFGFALQNANTSRIFESLGAETKDLAFYWLAAPVTGLIIQPIIGYLSDRTWHPRWGRRRPFFAIGAILATIALLLMPNSFALWMAIGMLWIMDGSINISMEPFRAFVGDMLPPEQRTRGFAMQSFFIGIGSVVASMLPWIFANLLGVNNTAPEGEIPDSVKFSFYAGAFAFITAVMWTVFTTKEYPPSKKSPSAEKKENTETTENLEKPSKYFKVGLLLVGLGGIFSLWFYLANFEPKLYVFSGVFILFGLAYLVSAWLMTKRQHHISLVQIIMDFQNMPKTMLQLAFVQFFSWFALFSMWIYSTSAVTSHIYDMKVEKSTLTILDEKVTNYLEQNLTDAEKSKAETTQKEIQKSKMLDKNKASLSINATNFFLEEDRNFELEKSEMAILKKAQKEYNDGADWVTVLFGGYNGIAALFAIFLPFITKKIPRKVVHMLALSLGGVGLISFYFISDPTLLILSMVGVGIAWACILSIPYAMLSASLPAHKMGYYMGIFNFFIVIPQIVAASILGFLVTQYFEGYFIFALIIGGIAMILAGLLSLKVKD